MQDYQIKFLSWLNSGKLSPAETAELEAIRSDDAEIAGRFSSNLAFGTGGLRGRMMLGTSAMNVYTVAQATQGFAMFINHVCASGAAAGGVPCVYDKRSPISRLSVVIAFDGRNNSRSFAYTAASVLAGNGIHVYIFDDIRPTPELSFAVRRLGCVAGINITASHNPKEYNGYKAYWNDGAQLAPEQADKIAAYMHRVDIWRDIVSVDFETALNSGHITIIGTDIDEDYINAVISEAIDLECIKREADNLSIVYTPLHGAGYRLVPEVLRRFGVKKLHSVPEQWEPDGNFPTLKKPNPEYPESFACGISVADKVGSDLIIATDPDADRVGVAARKADGSFATITGNQMASLLIEYIINSLKRTGRMPFEPYAVKTIVTTELMAKICRANGVEIYNVLTGFKYIGEVIKNNEDKGRNSFIFGAEESYGYLKGTYARDKDAVVASMLICEMTAHYKSLGMTLIDALSALYSKYGFSLEKTDEFAFDGYDGAARMKALMESLRVSSPDNIAGVDVLTLSDYLTDKVVNVKTGVSGVTGLPASDVLRFELETADVIIIRPSGTEPKLKVYFLLSCENEKKAAEQLEKYREAIRGILNIKK